MVLAYDGLVVGTEMVDVRTAGSSLETVSCRTERV